MRLFLDTEFSDQNLLRAELISLALVAEDVGTELYFERDPLLEYCSPFVFHHVIPLLDRGEAALTDSGTIPAIRWQVADDAELADRPSERRHHALLDARALRDAWMATFGEG